MIDTVLFDLDGTLARFTQKAFIDTYFAELAKVFIKMGMDAGQSIKAVWAGTKSMYLNDGSRTNAAAFWESFGNVLGLDAQRIGTVESACDSFYENEFDAVKSIVDLSDVPQRLLRRLTSEGYHAALATNPLFPECAVVTRLRWIGLSPGDFIHITHYSNSSFCKPNLEYYKDVLDKIGKKPEQCIMVGNNPAEDMIAGKLGMQTYLVTDCLENEAGADISSYRHGSLAQLETALFSLLG